MEENTMNDTQVMTNTNGTVINMDNKRCLHIH